MDTQEANDRYVEHQVLEALRHPLTAKQIAAKVQLETHDVRRALQRLESAGRVVRRGQRYSRVAFDVLKDVQRPDARRIAHAGGELTWDQVVAALDTPATASELGERLGANHRRVSDMLHRYVRKGDLEVVGKRGREYVYTIRERDDEGEDTGADLLAKVRHIRRLAQEVERDLGRVTKERDEAQAKLTHALRTLQ